MNQQKQDGQQPNLQQHFHQHKQNSSQSPQTYKINYRFQYFKLLDRSQDDKIAQNTIISKLFSQNIKYSPQDFHEQIHIDIMKHTDNYQALKINVFYGKMNACINVINVDIKSPIRNLCQSFIGGFGIVYKYYVDNAPIAIKCIKMSNNKFETDFRQIIKEYFFLMVASSLKVGPNLVKFFGFDIVVFRNSFVFTMQFCQTKYGIDESISSLKEKLHILHYLNIVHLDIKPENIAYSPINNQFIFIDFGLSRIIKQQLGTKTYTNFMGSFNFCSTEMLELYLSQSNGLIDLYYNDAFSLIKSLNNLNQIQMPYQEFIFRDQIENQELNQCQVILNVKFLLLEFSLGFFTSQPKFVEKQCVFIDKKKYQIERFIKNLPQPFYFVKFYKQKFNKLLKFDDQNIRATYDQTIKREAIDQNKIQQLFQSRFQSINRINQNTTEQRPKQIAIKLSDPKSVKNVKFGLYKLALIKFLSLNNIVEDLTQKINACLVYSQIYMKDVQKSSDINLYKKTIQHIFQSSMQTQEQYDYKIILHSVQDIIILEITTQERLIQIYNSILLFKIQFLPKMYLIFKFIESLEFIQQKFKTIYKYDRLIVLFLTNLNNFFSVVQEKLATVQQKQVFQRLKFIINRKIPFENEADYKCNFNEKQIEKQPNQLKLLNQNLMLYLIYNETISQIDKFSFYKLLHFKILMIFANRLSSYSYSHGLLFLISYITNQNALCKIIYSIFYSKLKHFEQHRHYSIYLLNKLNIVKQVYSNNFFILRKEIQEKQLNYDENQIEYEQIFQILDFIVKTTPSFHTHLKHLFSITTIYLNPTCMKYLINLISTNRQIITKLSLQYHNGGKHFHNNKLKSEIYVINCILQVLLKFTYDQEYQNQYLEFIHHCDEVISKSNCFQCKVHGFLQLKQLQINTIDYKQKQQQAFLIVLGILAVSLKHRELKSFTLPIFTTNLVRRWIKSQILFKKYDLNAFLYQLIKHNKQYHYCLIDIRQYNIFANLYVQIGKMKQITQMTLFIINILDSLVYKKSKTLTYNFYNSLRFIVSINEKTKTITNFIDYHEKVIKQLLNFRHYSRKQKFLALYFSVLLQLDIYPIIRCRMLEVICLSMNYLDHYTKNLILNQYFRHFFLSFQLSPKKSKYLHFKHLKKCTYKMSLKSIIKAKLKVISKKHQHLKKINLFKSSIKKYHKNIDNLA